MAKRTQRPAQGVLPRMRALCLAYPEAWEDAPWGHPVFKVGKKIFVSLGEEEQEGWGLSAPVGHELQELLLQQPGYYRPAYVGNKGWIGVRLGAKTDWQGVTSIVDIAYRRVALKRQVRLLDDGDAPPQPRAGRGPPPRARKRT